MHICEQGKADNQDKQDSPVIYTEIKKFLLLLANNCIPWGDLSANRFRFENPSGP